MDVRSVGAEVSADLLVVDDGYASRFLGHPVEQPETIATAIRIGNPATEDVLLGPMISAAQVQRVERIVNASIDAGATLLTGGTADGLYYPPTVLANVMSLLPVDVATTSPTSSTASP